MLQNLGVNVLPQSVAIGGAFQAFEEETGDLIDPKQQGMLKGAVQALFLVTRDTANRDATCDMIETLEQHTVENMGVLVWRASKGAIDMCDLLSLSRFCSWQTNILGASKQFFSITPCGTLKRISFFARVASLLS